MRNLTEARPGMIVRFKADFPVSSVGEAIIPKGSFGRVFQVLPKYNQLILTIIVGEANYIRVSVYDDVPDDEPFSINQLDPVEGKIDLPVTSLVPK